MPLKRKFHTGVDKSPGDAMAVAARRLEAIRAAFPSRAMKVAPPTPGLSGLVSNLWAVLISVIAAFSMFSYLPLLITDVPLALSGLAVVLEEQYLGPGSKCRYWAVVVTTCDLELRARSPDGLWQSRSVSFAHFFGRPASMADFRIVGLPAEPYWLTVDTALDRVLNRLLTAAFLIGGALALTLFFAKGSTAGWRFSRRTRAALSGKVLVPVLLHSSIRAEGGRVTKRNQKPAFGLRLADAETEVLWTNPRGEALFPLGRPQHDPPAMVLGVTVQGSGVVMPLDRALTWIGLTDEERRRLLAAALLDAGGRV